MNTKVVKKFLYVPALFTALALIATSECLTIGGRGAHRAAYEKSDRIQRNSKNQGRPCNGRVPNCRRERRVMALTTMIVNVTACAQLQDRDDDYLNIYWKDGRGFEWKPGASEGICYPCDETQMANYLVFWINRGGLYNYPLKYFPASQPDGT